MRKREIDRYRAELESQLAGLVGHGAQVVHALSDAGGEEVPDPSDRATMEEGRNWSLRLSDRDRRLISKIEGALARLEDGTFGTCSTCGKPISPARLRARPVTDLCIDCKTEAERGERRR
jgi:DnaK suppressor protein